MAPMIQDELVESPGPASPASPESGDIPLDRPVKLKGRQRLLKKLQRISSSSSLSKLRSSSSTGYRSGDKGSRSCISLSSSLAYNNRLGDLSPSPYQGNLSASPLSPSTPTATTPTQDPIARLRHFDADPKTSPTISPTSIPLPADIRPASRGLPLESTCEVPEILAEEGVAVDIPEEPVREPFDFWGSVPHEIRLQILGYLDMKKLVQCSSVSKTWNKWCFDGQLWPSLDTTDFYRAVPSGLLVKVMKTAGPFIKDLNLRGVIQLKDQWHQEGGKLSGACGNLQNLSIEGCRIDLSSIHTFLQENRKLLHIDLSGLTEPRNAAMKKIARGCPQLESLNVSWCSNIDTHGLKAVVTSCPRLKELRADEVKGFDNESFMLELFHRNNLERLIMHRCSSLTDASLKVLLQGNSPEIDVLTDRPIVPPRKLKHLDLTRCRRLTDEGIRLLAYNVPDLEGLHLSQNPSLTDAAFTHLFESTPRLTHIDLEELDKLSNDTLIELSQSPCAPDLEHLNISYCENLSDGGMLPILRMCPSLTSLDMDNTAISDLVLMEAGVQIRKRGFGNQKPTVGLRMVAFDCRNVTWAGIREIIASNTYSKTTAHAFPTLSEPSISEEADNPEDTENAESDGESLQQTPSIPPTPSPPADLRRYPNEIIQFKGYYRYQMVVDEHTKRVLRGDMDSAKRLERKWVDYMMVTEEADAGGAAARRRIREIENLLNDDAAADFGLGYLSFGLPFGSRRRALSGGLGGVCTVM